MCRDAGARRKSRPGSTDWAKEYYDVRMMEIRDDGGHFAPAENPTAVVEDLRKLFRPLRA